MYLATYEYTYWCDGNCSTEATIEAATLEELREKMAKRHYEVFFGDGSNAYSFSREGAGETTYNWAIYKLVSGADIKTLPEFLALVEDRKQRQAAATERKVREKAEAAETERLRREAQEREDYERLKAKFEGGVS